MRVASRRELQRIRVQPARPILAGPHRETATDRYIATNRGKHKQEKPDTRSGFQLLPRLDSNQ